MRFLPSYDELWGVSDIHMGGERRAERNFQIFRRGARLAALIDPLRTLRPGVVVGEITLYTGVARTADVVAETRCVVLRIGRDTIERLEAEEPKTAAMLHRWLATTLAERLTDSMRAFDVLLG